MNYKISQGAFWATEKAETLTECIKYRATTNDTESEIFSLVGINDDYTPENENWKLLGTYSVEHMNYYIYGYKDILSNNSEDNANRTDTIFTDVVVNTQIGNDKLTPAYPAWGSIVPENVTVCLNGVTFNAGNTLPESGTLTNGDTVTEPEYTYVFDSSINGWNVTQNDKTDASPNAPRNNILGVDITGIKSCFENNTFMTETPEITSSVSNCDRAFAGCTNLTTATISENITSANGAFENCTNLNTIIINSPNLTSFDNILDGTTQLINIEGTLGTEDIIESIANDYPNAINTFVIHDGLAIFNDDAYGNTDGITGNVSLHWDKLKLQEYGNIYGYNASNISNYLIDNSTFENNNRLISIITPETLTNIGEHSISNCPNLQILCLGKNVTTIGQNYKFDKLSIITVDEENAPYDTRDNCNAIIKTDTNTLVLGCKSTVIPNTVMSKKRCC